MNLKMPALQKCFEGMGLSDVKTVLASGNVLFASRATPEATLEKKCEVALLETIGKEFMTIVRSVDHLRELIDEDPYAKYRLPAESKRVVTFLRDAPKSRPKLPIELDGARILALRDREVLSAYVVSSKGPVFMTLIEKTFGKQVTTRTWDTVKKLAR